ncbi:MAG: adenosylcobinamide-GDP ribazoletransferase [Tepidimonas ignava]|uniref:Adenosylcobinamide-GDP ribazoletransferase n=1 Tax=Tepidimonas ignava TaxID=114249 RepID=A0A4R3LIC1_9BURK|nr:adenosylcobinamide-GDP ribazoletransferase [Tepidimonas ignava]MCX7815300.1 adenosylcobinamide-GDP ribazoletransferase [Tepidimonas ignava]TCS99939.1 cobalamin-5'-phosphate synthase [Tepidimonas ignava]TSE23324.1 Adenosylcobinamide-GDP ribazoletransferase [Tepidimonas ignava]
METLLRGVRHALLALQFFTRVPVTGRLAAWVGYSPAMLRASAAYFPLVGAVVGALAAAVLAWAPAWLPDQPARAWVVAVLACAATVWLTGAFHEDGWADTCDALGGVVPRERALAIMKDSRIGSYAAVGVALLLMLKVGLLALLLQTHATLAPALAWAAHGVSRYAPLWVMRTLPYVGDTDGCKAKPLADAIDGRSLALASAWTAALVLALLAWRPLAPAAWCGALLLALLAGWRLRAWLARRLQGFTGDTLGATQQVVEAAFLLGACMGLATQVG